MTDLTVTDFNQPWGEPAREGRLWTSRPGQPSSRNEPLYRKIREYRESLRPLCTAWRQAAEADGWIFTPTYGDHEPLESAFRGTKEGFVMQGLCRPTTDKEAPCPSIHIWGPDGLAIAPPLEYDMAAIRAGLRACAYCDEKDVETQRVGFAGRCCQACLPAMRKAIERPGWTS